MSDGLDASGSGVELVVLLMRLAAGGEGLLTSLSSGVDAVLASSCTGGSPLLWLFGDLRNIENEGMVRSM